MVREEYVVSGPSYRRPGVREVIVHEAPPRDFHHPPAPSMRSPAHMHSSGSGHYYTPTDASPRVYGHPSSAHISRGPPPPHYRSASMDYPFGAGGYHHDEDGLPHSMLPKTKSSFVKSSGCTCKKSRCLKLYCLCFASSTTCGSKCKCQSCENNTMHAESIEEARRMILERNPAAFDDKMSPPRVVQQPHWGERPPYGHMAPTMERYYPPPPSQQREPMLMSPPPSRTAPPQDDALRMSRVGCKCRRSLCLRKYCDCFRAGSSCGHSCQCTNCNNLSGDEKEPTVTPEADRTVAMEAPRRVSSDESTRLGEHEQRDAIFRRLPSVMEHSERHSERHPTASIVKAGEPSDTKMALMAAVAMTELLGISGPQGKKKDEGSTDAVVKLDGPFNKRLREESMSDMEVDRPLTKKARPESPEDEEMRAVPLPHSYMHVESRNPSPEVKLPVTESAQTRPPPQMLYQRRPAPSPSAHYHFRGPPSKAVDHYISDMSISRSLYRSEPPVYRYGPSPPSTPRMPAPTYRLSPPPRIVDRSFSLGSVSSQPYDEILRTSGLPKSLSFRKICSRCGKTRSEHGEHGFGHKCIFDDCGKCGATLRFHKQAGQPMGILCQLTVQEGALPGAAEAYQRKIKELAARADLQRALQDKRKEEEASATESHAMTPKQLVTGTVAEI